MDACGKKPVLAMEENMSNFLMHLRRHHMKQYAELIEAGEVSTKYHNSYLYLDIINA